MRLKLIIMTVFILSFCGSTNSYAQKYCDKVYYEGGPNKDKKGFYYETVQIGNQCWLKENLNIGIVASSMQLFDSRTNNSKIKKYCYNDEEINCLTYGGLYQWDEAMQYATTEGSRGICPNGWHIPTKKEYEILVNGFSNNNISDNNPFAKGNALKAKWQDIGAGAGTNVSGFSALIGGFRNQYGSSQGLGTDQRFLSSTENNSEKAFYLCMYGARAYFLNLNKLQGCSVRCLKD